MPWPSGPHPAIAERAAGSLIARRGDRVGAVPGPARLVIGLLPPQIELDDRDLRIVVGGLSVLGRGASIPVMALLHPLEPLEGPVQLPIVAGLVPNQLVHRPGSGQRGGAELGVEIQLLDRRDLLPQPREPAPLLVDLVHPLAAVVLCNTRAGLRLLS